MRKLTVKRKWSFIESGSKIYLYVQCSKANSTHSIGGNYFVQIPIKNGKTVTAEILDDVPTIIMIGSSTARTEYTIPAGTADVNLLTKPHYNLAEGNPFTFETM